jgi:P4 family phage/plasmid primase-like protien
MEQSNSSAKNINFIEYLNQHNVKKGKFLNKPITNTRIPGAGSSGGSYHIPDGEYATFLKLYYQYVFVHKKIEHLTEIQREAGDGPILVDLDFRHDYEILDRQYSRDHIMDLIDVYLEEFKTMYQLDDDSKFPIFVFQKPSVNRVADKKITKDGIHLVFGVKADHITQQILRERVVKRIKDVWTDLPLKNSFDDVFDKGISTGKTGWQLYGSRKPEHERYELSFVVDVQYDNDDGAFMTPDKTPEQFNVAENMYLLSARYNQHVSFIMKSSFISEYTEFKRIHGGGSAAVRQVSSNAAAVGGVGNPSSETGSGEHLSLTPAAISKIKTREELDMYLNAFLENLQSNSDYELRTTYEYVMALPESYYEEGEGTYNKWVRVCWVLRNTSQKLLIVWIAFSARAKKFSFRSIPDLCDKWRQTDLKMHNGLTKRSLINWVKTDAKEKYEEINKNSIDYFVEKTISASSQSLDCGGGGGKGMSGCGEYDLAYVLYQMYKSKYVCVSIKNSIWYKYENHRWKINDSATCLRTAISTKMRELYRVKSENMLSILLEKQNEEENLLEPAPAAAKKADPARIRAKAILNIEQRLARTNDKKNIITEAKDLFHDDTFMEKMDMNPYLLCFTNGVFDFKEKIFRAGLPEDNISMCTNIEYVPLNTQTQKQIIDEINDFFAKLFPEEELREYMWDHLASTLIGTCLNQAFNVYIGDGQNGKSALIDLMNKVLGDYKGDVPLSLVTEKRAKIGGLAPEIVKLKGVRFAVMQEPSKTDKINEGAMKQMTGKDSIQGRGLYMQETMSFVPQFNLVVTANVFMEISSTDHGTWRRICAVPFKSLFTENPRDDDPMKPYQFKLVKNIDEKFDSWKEVFAAMLVDRACKTNGIVTPCSIVKEKSNEYRRQMDSMAEFVQDVLEKNADSFVTKSQIIDAYKFWYNSTINDGPAKHNFKEICACVEKTLGVKMIDQKFRGIAIRTRSREPLYKGNHKGGEDDDDTSIEDVDV